MYLLQAIKAAEEHLVEVAKERSKYRSACKDSKSELTALFTSNGTFQPPPQLVGEYNGNNWSEFFEDCDERHHTNARFSADHPKGITQMHHFRFSADHPGVVFVKNASDDLKERKINLLKSTTWRPTPTNLPKQIIPTGLSLERTMVLVPEDS